MQIVNLYRFHREDGGVTVSPNKPDVEYETLYRLIADEGKALTQNGEDTTFCIDANSTDGWYEIDYIEPANDILEG